MAAQPTVLGIQIGHDSACAIVKGNDLLAAVQQERVSRRKRDGSEVISNALPIVACLEAAKIDLKSVDMVVSSFQAASPAGSGLHQPLIHPDFNIFDVSSVNHYVMAHHLAHAYCAFGCSGFERATAVVCDLAGSTTIDGKDYFETFNDWDLRRNSHIRLETVKTECLSFYQIDGAGAIVLDREFCVPHNAPGSFIQNACSLYDNISRFIFKKDNAHGEMMALASLGVFQACSHEPIISDSDLVEIVGSQVLFKNNWQHRVVWQRPLEEYAPLAAACQSAFEQAMVAYSKRAAKLCDYPNLVAAGGAFLNIPSNSRISETWNSGAYFVPSSPHDAGVAVGCAFYGSNRLGGRPNVRRHCCDRLGREYGPQAFQFSIERFGAFVEARPFSCEEIAQLIYEGKILGRIVGRAEFGPRALGGRSLLASPLLAENKDRLNVIKGRQKWRPVAPILLFEEVGFFFEGPASSPYMSYTHRLKQSIISRLPALKHEDGTTRVQTFDSADDPALANLLRTFGELSGFPILCNTSMNSAGEPIVETPDDAIRFFLRSPDVDALIFGDLIVRRSLPWQANNSQNTRVRFCDETVIHTILPASLRRVVLTRKGRSEQLPEPLYKHLDALVAGAPIGDLIGRGVEQDENVSGALFSLAALEYLSLSEGR